MEPLFGTEFLVLLQTLLEHFASQEVFCLFLPLFRPLVIVFDSIEVVDALGCPLPLLLLNIALLIG